MLDERTIQLLANPAKIDALNDDEKNDFEQTVIEYFLNTPQLLNIVEEMTGGVTKALGRMLMGQGDGEEQEDDEEGEEEYDEETDEDEEVEEILEPGTAKLPVSDIEDGSIIPMVFNREQCAKAAEFLTENQLYIKLSMGCREPGTMDTAGMELLLGYDGDFIMQPFTKTLNAEWDRSPSALVLNKKLDALFENLMAQMDILFKIECNAYIYNAKTKQEWQLIYDNRPPEAFIFECLAILMQSTSFKKSALPKDYAVSKVYGQDLAKVAVLGEDGELHQHIYVNNKNKNKGKDWYLWVTDYRAPMSEYDVRYMEVFKNKKSIGQAKTKEQVIEMLK